MLSLTAKQGEVLWPHYIQGSLLSCRNPPYGAFLAA